MLNLPAKSLQTIRRYLLRQKQDVEKQLRRVDRDDPTTSFSLAESSEPGTDSWLAAEHAKTMAMKSQLGKTAQNIKISLMKIKRGTYGKCEKCGKNIEIGRLMVFPTAAYCLGCSNKKDK